MKNLFIDSFLLVLKLACYIIPLMIILEFSKENDHIESISNSIYKVLKKYGYSKAAVFPLLIGVLFGITYGSGVIVQSNKEGRLEGEDKRLLSDFLNICHAIPEDTLLFATLNTPNFIVVSLFFICIALPRLLLAFIANKYLPDSNKIDSNSYAPFK